MAENPSTPKIRIGPAGWSYKDWIGIVYKRPHLRNPLQQWKNIELGTLFRTF